MPVTVIYGHWHFFNLEKIYRARKNNEILILYKYFEQYNKRFEACYKDNLHSIWANQELYRPGNTLEELGNILEKNMRPVYDSARRQGYEMWNMASLLIY